MSFGFQPKPRENLGPLHMLPPRFEQILGVGRSLKKEQRTVGTVASQATLVAEGDPERQPISVPFLAMIYRQTGIPFNNPDIPNIGKLDSRVPAGFYYYQYTKPVYWMKDESFRHIPGYSRYVINESGTIANAWSAKEVGGDSPYMVELSADGANNVRKVPRTKLMALAFTSLPEDFVDYGRGNHSHDYEFDAKEGHYRWIPKPELITKNNLTGVTDEYRNLFDFQENAGLQFDERIQIKAPMAFTGVLNGEVLQVGSFMVKEKNPPVKEESKVVEADVPEKVEVPVPVQVADAPSAQPAPVADIAEDIEW